MLERIFDKVDFSNLLLWLKSDPVTFVGLLVVVFVLGYLANSALGRHEIRGLKQEVRVKQSTIDHLKEISGAASDDDLAKTVAEMKKKLDNPSTLPLADIIKN